MASSTDRMEVLTTLLKDNIKNPLVLAGVLKILDDLVKDLECDSLTLLAVRRELQEENSPHAIRVLDLIDHRVSNLLVSISR